MDARMESTPCPTTRRSRASSSRCPRRTPKKEALFPPRGKL